MTSTKIDLKQREHLVSLVECAKRKEKEQLEEQNGVTRESIINALGKSKGVAAYLTKHDELQKKIEALQATRIENEEALEELGFDFRNNSLSLRWDAPVALKTEFAQKTEDARRPIEKSLKKYDLGLARIWMATTSEELAKAVEGLI